VPAFYLPLGADRFEATAATAGPWDPGHQHGGPPSALLTRAIEAIDPRPELRLARLAVDILGPLPLGELSVTARVLRPGRSVELLQAEMVAGGRAVLRATGWRIRATPEDVPAPRAEQPALPRPEDVATETEHGWDSGYLDAIEWRFVSGHFQERGPAVAWTRMRMPLVEGEKPSPAQRAIVIADSGNGISNVLDIRSWLFVNPDLTVHLTRPPRGEWLCLAAATTVEPGGVGLARSTISDVDGVVGHGAQALYVAAR